ncbi:MAG: entericidin A/B family lipoprotein [Candidatus Hydrogenedentes bacterium]|nr:entericidin A/B family lipoprotein [Candidatus Hydrogenedentota bacterium]
MLRHWVTTLVFAAALVSLVAAQGCNTVRGVGKDVEAGGKAIQRSTTK